ncbi:MAG TPA: hypothetical protein VEI73_00305 [Candidatus Acidoferrum sp.]|nr:hypothetical protein [Candidatus Acidoferrum sp.]
MTAGFPHLGARRRVRLRNRFFNTGYCDSFRFSWRNFLFPGEFDCYGGAFFSDPFFYGGSPGTYFWSDSLATSGGYGGSAETADASDLSPDYPDKPESLGPSLWNVQEPVALLRLLDGSTYGLLRYWVEGTRLHYVTSYGGENSVPLEGIDFVGTQELNASSGKRFDLLEDCHKP